jgi:hypothetical protein
MLYNLTLLYNVIPKGISLGLTLLYNVIQFNNVIQCYTQWEPIVYYDNYVTYCIF